MTTGGKYYYKIPAPPHPAPMSHQEVRGEEIWGLRVSRKSAYLRDVMEFSQE